MKRYQEKNLRLIVKNAYTFVKYYHKLFRNAGIKPDDISRIEDLTKIPITNKDHFRKLSTEEVLHKDVDVSNLRSLTTSGSTGRPLKLYISNSEDDWRKAIFMRANLQCGQRLRDKWVVVASPRHFGSTTKIQNLLRVYSQICVSVFEAPTSLLQKIACLKPDVLDGYSSAILLIAKESAKNKDYILRPRIIFGNAEVIDNSSRKIIEETFNAPYYDQYGCVEFNRTAWECPEKNGYHMDVDSVITEFVDESGESVSPGENGRIVQTSLFNYAMPFIRYEIGDVGVPSNDKCNCGVSLPIMKQVEGRRDSFIILPDGQFLSPRTLTVAISMFKYYSWIEQFRFVQKRLDLIEISLKMKDNTLDENLVGTSLVNYLGEVIPCCLPKVNLNVKFVDRLTIHKNGKTMTVSSEIINNL